jgi:hypothetical protein
VRQVLPAVIAAALLAPAACGDGESQPLVGPPPRSDPADLYGTWTATQPGGYKLRYVFRPDGTYRHFSGVRERKRGGRATFAINARGTMSIRGRTLVLRPRSGTQTRRDTSDPAGDYTRPVQKTPQRYRWTIRGTGKTARLTLSIGGALAVTYRRQ